jgi:hypothetical protein
VSQGWVLASGEKLSARMLSTGSSRLTPLALALSSAALAMSILSSSTSDLPVVTPLGALEGVSHAADDDQRVDLVEQVVDDVDLAGDLGAADDGDEGLLGSFEGFAEIGDFLFHQQAGDGGLEEVGDAFGGGVGAMRGAEGVVDVDLGQRGEGFGEGWIVGFFFGVVAQVLKQQDLAGFKLARHFEAISPMQSGAKATLME